MKILVQTWLSEEKGCLTSISKDQAQLDATFKRVKKQEPEIKLDGKALEIEILDDSVFAEMVGRKTVFLCPDEMDLVYNAIER